MKLTLEMEEIICHAMELESSKPSLTAEVIVTFKDENGVLWQCDKEIRLRLRKTKKVKE